MASKLRLNINSKAALTRVFICRFHIMRIGHSAAARSMNALRPNAILAAYTSIILTMFTSFEDRESDLYLRVWAMALN